MIKITTPFLFVIMLMIFSVLNIQPANARMPMATPFQSTDSVSHPKTENEHLVYDALTALFVNKDVTAIDKYFAENYTQHNPQFGNGRDVLKGLLSASKDFKYEPGFITSNDNIVMIHGRYSGFGKPSVTVDIFRVENHKIVEHWDIEQEEVPATATKSGNPMFR